MANRYYPKNQRFYGKYTQGKDTTAVTLNKKTRICGREMFETKVKDIFVVILAKGEQYLENKK